MLSSFGVYTLNLDSTTSGEAQHTRTILYETTAGVSWYLNDYVRMMGNYTLAVPATRYQPALPVHGFGLRTAVYW